MIQSESELEDTDEIIYIHPNQHELDISQLILSSVTHKPTNFEKH